LKIILQQSSKELFKEQLSLCQNFNECYKAHPECCFGASQADIRVHNIENVPATHCPLCGKPFYKD
jgi:hypothetical protein